MPQNKKYFNRRNARRPQQSLKSESYVAWQTKITSCIKIGFPNIRHFKLVFFVFASLFAKLFVRSAGPEYGDSRTCWLGL